MVAITAFHFFIVHRLVRSSCRWPVTIQPTKATAHQRLPFLSFFTLLLLLLLLLLHRHLSLLPSLCFFSFSLPRSHSSPLLSSAEHLQGGQEVGYLQHAAREESEKSQRSNSLSSLSSPIRLVFCLLCLYDLNPLHPAPPWKPMLALLLVLISETSSSSSALNRMR